MSNQKLLTPVCRVKYPHIFTPNTTFQPHVYSIDCVIEETTEWQNLLEELERQLKEFYTSQQSLSKKKLAYCEPKPWNKTDKDGDSIFHIKSKTEGTNKTTGQTFSLKPDVRGPNIEVKMYEHDFTQKLGNGSLMRVGFSTFPYNHPSKGVGLMCNLSLVQVLEPVYYDPLAKFQTPTGEKLTSQEREWFSALKQKKQQSKIESVEVSGMEIDDIFAKAEIVT